MGRGLGNVQESVLKVVNANADGVSADAIASGIFGGAPTASQLESVRRALRSLVARGLVDSVTRLDRRTRRSRKRLVDLTPCMTGLCRACGERKRRVRLADWHRRVMRENAKVDAAWLDDLAAAEASGFVHQFASPERVVDTQPSAIDDWVRRIRFYVPAPTASAP